MKKIEETVRTIGLSHDDKKMLAEAYDLIWRVQQEVFRDYYHKWLKGRDNIVDTSEQAMNKIAEFAQLFMTDEEFGAIATSMRE